MATAMRIPRLSRADGLRRNARANAQNVPMPMIDHELGFVDATSDSPSGTKVTTTASVAAAARPAGRRRSTAASRSDASSALTRRITVTERSTSCPTNTDIAV